MERKNKIQEHLGGRGKGGESKVRIKRFHWSYLLCTTLFPKNCAARVYEHLVGIPSVWTMAVRPCLRGAPSHPKFEVCCANLPFSSRDKMTPNRVDFGSFILHGSTRPVSRETFDLEACETYAKSPSARTSRCARTWLGNWCTRTRSNGEHVSGNYTWWFCGSKFNTDDDVYRLLRGMV